MSQVSAFLRRTEAGYVHWCPGCEEVHQIWTGRPQDWTFDGNVNAPTFNPSIRVTGVQTVKVNGKWTGEWVRGPDGEALPNCCHYFLRDGQLHFLGDCTHALANRTVPLPALPSFLTDEGT